MQTKKFILVPSHVLSRIYYAIKRNYWRLNPRNSQWFSTVLMTYYIGKSVDTMVGKGQVNAAQLIKILGLLAGILLVTVLSQWLIQRLGNRVSYLSTTQLRKDAFAHLNQLPLSYYDQTSHGNIVSRFTNDIDNISMACSAVFNQLFSGMATVVVALLFMIRLSPLLTLVVLISTPIIFIVNWLVAKASQKLCCTTNDCW